MANTLRIKRRAAGGAAGAPASLANAELAIGCDYAEVLDDPTHGAPQAGDVIFKRNDYSTTFFFIVEGELDILIEDDQEPDGHLKAGEFFGELALVSGRRRAGTVRATQACVLIETPRRVMQKLIDSVQSIELKREK